VCHTLAETALGATSGGAVGLECQAMVMKNTCFWGVMTTTVCEKFGRETDARLVYDADPQQLVARLALVYATEHYKHPSRFCRESSPAG